MNPSPLRYPGGKHKLYPYVAKLIEINDCTTYIEPFCGGAAIPLELLFHNNIKRVILNDYDYSIYCFWESVLTDTDAFSKKIFDTSITVNEWKKQKQIRSTFSQHTPLEVGFSTFFLNRVNHSGIIDKAGPIGGLNQTGRYSIDCRFNKRRLIDQIEKIALYQPQISIYNLEALDFIESVILKTRRSFTLFDPPYYNKGPVLYTNFYSHDDHQKLADAITHNLRNRKWIVTYDNSNEINKMYSKTKSIEFSLQYSLQSKRFGSEVMFFSSKTLRPSNEDKYIKIL